MVAIVKYLFLAVLIALVSHGSAAPQFMYIYCPDTAFFPANNSAYQSNIDTLLSNLSSTANKSSIAGFSNFSVGTGSSRSPIIYGLYLCRGGDDPSTCREWVATASSYLSSNCPRGAQAADWYDECMVRYSNASIFGQLDDGFSVLAWNLNNISINASGFNQVLDATLTKVVNEAPADKSGPYKYLATDQAKFNEFESVYALGQCTPDLSESDCFQCLQKGYGQLSTWTRQGGRALYLNCNLRYEIAKFYQTGDSKFSPMYTYCPDTTLFPATTNSSFRSNINSLLSTLSLSANQSTTPGYYNYTIGGNTSTSAYGFYLCRGDISPATCRDCVSAASVDLPHNCKYSKQAAILYDLCMIRYSNEYFFGELPSSSTHPLWNVTQSSANFVSDQFSMGYTLASAIDTVRSKASIKGEGGEMLGTDNIKISDYMTLYMLGQCTPDLSPDDCGKCLQDCSDFLKTSTSHQIGSARVYFFSCNLRYELYQFYQASQSPEIPILIPVASHSRGSPILAPSSPITTPKLSKPGRHLPLIITFSVIGLLLLFLGLILWFSVSKVKFKPTYTVDLSDIVTSESLQMDLITIRTATHNFAIERKLGQGGFGSVYKGTLENGQDIAVKRLSDNSRQGIVEFKAEVLLVAKLQHRNLVRLLGFCVAGKEIILVYEFLPNSSLDRILFDPTKRMSLNWETRFKIISGIAKGLMYLHEDSRLRVIHRDFKSSNILLDDTMNPKISDFGLAKLFSIDQTQDVTDSIAGTYGYMAPEYVLMGHYSIKSDVYSFGVIVLEVVSGQRNKYIQRPLLEEALLYRAWRFWHEGEALKLVDEALGDSYSREDVIKCIHIGLLCIQESVAKRPNMTSIVAALGGQSITLPLPSTPNFFSSSNPASTGVSSGKGVSVSIPDTSELTELHVR